MNLPSILALAGCAALLIGLLGGGVKAKEVEVPPISFKTRIISSGIGAILIVVSLLLFLSGEKQHLAKANIPTSSASVTHLPAEVAQVESHAPIIKSVVIREDWTEGTLVLYQDVAYTDLDGDAENIDWILVKGTEPNLSITDGKVDDSIEQQKAGGIFSGVWKCLGKTYRVTIQAVLIDKEGNKSTPIEYDLNCHE